MKNTQSTRQQENELLASQADERAGRWERLGLTDEARNERINADLHRANEPAKVSSHRGW